MNIYEKMLGVTSELSAVAKNLEVGYGQNRYKATGEADILAAIKPLESKYKIYSFPVSRRIVETGELETKTGTKNLFLRIETAYRFVNVEKPDEFIEITSYGDGVDSQDKSVGKAMTYSDKYALMKAYKIITGDDPDQYMSEETVSKKSGKKKAEVSSDTKPEQKMDSRQLLIEFCKRNNLNMTDVAKRYKLSPKSSQEAFEKALDDLAYQKTMMEEGSEDAERNSR